MDEKFSYSVGLGDAKVDEVRGALVPWFRENGRDLPWRRTRDPWRVLVSEVMLQQIQVKRAIPFYEVFIERFPTVEALAGAPLAEAIRVWGDLGRYRRVVNLHRTARIVVEEYGGGIPADPSVLMELPGIGPYTAGAVACFAFERPVAFADTNVRRVLHRLFLGAEVPESAVPVAEILGLAERLVPVEGAAAWEWNQALMELGALVCTARGPLCEGCPVSDACEARPVIRGVLAALPRAHEPAYRYEGSNRFYRGRALAALREAPEDGVLLRDLGEALCAGFTLGDAPWLRNIVESLEKDGLAVVEGNARETKLRDKEPPAPPDTVAEKRTAYDASPTGGSQPEVSDEDLFLVQTRVRLP